MVFTNFPNGITSLGVPTFGAGGLLPFTGNYWWVNETTGSDGNTGNDPAFPLKTLAQAQSNATATNNDVVFVTGSIHVTKTLVWAKNWVHLIGLAAPNNNPRARISTQTVANGLTQTQFSALHPQVSVTASGCIFANLENFYGGDGTLTPPTAAVAWADTGGRNYYYNVRFAGGGDALMAALAGMRSLTLGPGDESVLEKCIIGLDTVQRATAVNASLELLSGTARNVFRACTFEMNTSLATDLHVTVGASGMDRYALFDGCVFINAVDSTSTTINAAIVANAAAGGSVVLNNPISLGATALATTGPVYVTGAVPTATTSGIAIKAT